MTPITIAPVALIISCIIVAYVGNIFWKKWPYWLRGGAVPLAGLVLAYVLGRIIGIIGLMLGNKFLSLTGFVLWAVPYSISIFGKGIIEIFVVNPSSTLGETSIMIITMIMLFGLGSLVGLIYGKLKKKRNSLSP